MSSTDTVHSVIQKEIQALNTLLNHPADHSNLIDAIANCSGRVVVSGMGKSGLIGRKISATLSSTATPSGFIHPAEALHGDLGTISNNDLVLALSNSGETEELLSLIPFLRRRNIPLAAMCCKVESTLAQKSDFLIPIPVDFEADPFSLIPTCTTTAMLAMGDALAVSVLIRRGLTREQFAELHPSGSLGRKLLLTVSDLMHGGEAIPRVRSQTSLRAAISLMGAKRLGAAFVVNANQPDKLLGVFTDGDLRRVLEQDDNPLEKVIDHWMTAAPVTVSPDALAVDALGTMQSRQITVLPVLDDQDLVGAVHLHDLLKAGLQ